MKTRSEEGTAAVKARSQNSSGALASYVVSRLGGRGRGAQWWEQQPGTGRRAEPVQAGWSPGRGAPPPPL